MLQVGKMTIRWQGCCWWKPLLQMVNLSVSAISRHLYCRGSGEGSGRVLERQFYSICTLKVFILYFIIYESDFGYI